MSSLLSCIIVEKYCFHMLSILCLSLIWFLFSSLPETASGLKSPARRLRFEYNFRVVSISSSISLLVSASEKASVFPSLLIVIFDNDLCCCKLEKLCVGWVHKLLQLLHNTLYRIIDFVGMGGRFSISYLMFWFDDFAFKELNNTGHLKYLISINNFIDFICLIYEIKYFITFLLWILQH